MASKLYGVNATIIIFVFALYCIVYPSVYPFIHPPPPPVGLAFVEAGHVVTTQAASHSPDCLPDRHVSLLVVVVMLMLMLMLWLFFFVAVVSMVLLCCVDGVNVVFVVVAMVSMLCFCCYGDVDVAGGDVYVVGDVAAVGGVLLLWHK